MKPCVYASVQAELIAGNNFWRQGRGYDHPGMKVSDAFVGVHVQGVRDILARKKWAVGAMPASIHPLVVRVCSARHLAEPTAWRACWRAKQADRGIEPLRPVSEACAVISPRHRASSRKIEHKWLVGFCIYGDLKMVIKRPALTIEREERFLDV